MTTAIGVIGCGVIAGAYLEAARRFPQIEVKALADRDPAAAEKRAAEFGIAAVPIEAPSPTPPSISCST
ncbi:MAG: hypothetical protein R3D25_18070 [Geminicoccaceae bacterium]